MPQVSRRKLNSETEEKIKNLFVDELTRISDKTEMASLVKRLLTESEKTMLAKRLVAFVMIEKGVPDVFICRSLYLTPETVARFRLIYSGARDKNEMVAKTIQQMSLKNELKKLMKKILIGYALPAAFGRIPRRSII